jgi:MinD-like ATPase involved in chromosome partitioning or flagellar assembly
MEKDTVLLDIEKYNELRDFKKEVEESLKESRFAVIEDQRDVLGFIYHTRKYYTESEAILDFETRNKELEAKIEELEAKIKKAGIKEPVEISINDLKKMSYWEFRKWRKS